MNKKITKQKIGFSVVIFAIFILGFIVIRWNSSFMYCERTYIKALGVTKWQYWRIQDEDRLLTGQELVNLITASVSNGNDIDYVTKVASELTAYQFHPCIVQGRKLNTFEKSKLDSLVQLGIHKCTNATRLKNEIGDRPDWYWNLMGENYLNEKHDSLILQVEEFKNINNALFFNYTDGQIDHSFISHGFDSYQSFRDQYIWEFSRGYGERITLFN